jgi:hypothetical protein
MNHERKNRKKEGSNQNNRSDLRSDQRTITRQLSPRRKVQSSWRDYQDDDSNTGESRGRVGRTSGRSSSSSWKSHSQERKESSPTVRQRRVVTLHNIHEALSNDQLKALLKNNYEATELIEVEVEDISVELDEDAVLKKIKRKTPRKRKVIKKSNYEIYPEKYLRWKKEPNLRCNADVVYGAYLEIYRVNFGEKDPEQIDFSFKKALLHINDMCHKLADGEYEQLITFIEQLIPLWAKRMRQGKDFPNMRPSFKTFFIKRNMWSQRFSIYKQWTQDAKHQI